jgi:hypothetical protein
MAGVAFAVAVIIEAALCCNLLCCSAFAAGNDDVMLSFPGRVESLMDEFAGMLAAGVIAADPASRL